MSDISKSAESQYSLDGVVSNAPIDWQDVKIVAQYPDDSIQPSLSIDEYKFNLDSRKAINKWIEGGITGGVGIFEGMPFAQNIFNNSSDSAVFNAFINFADNYNDATDDGVLSVSIMKDDSIQSFIDKLGGVTCGYLEEIGVFTDADYITIPYIVEKKLNPFELMMSAIVLYLMIKELAETVERTARSAVLVVSLLGTSVFPLPIGSIAYAIASALIQLVYSAILIIAIIELAKTLFETLIPPKRNHKGILLKHALEKIANHLGYNFNCPITEYNNYVYLPSNPNLDEKSFFGTVSVTKGTQSGIPNSLDYGYFAEDLFTLGKSLPYAKMAIIGNTIELRPKNDPFWIQQSQWVMPDVLINTLGYNMNELNATNLLSFSVDTSDDWTVDNYGGTSIEIKTDPVSVLRQRAVLLKGLDEVNFQVALGNRKDELTGIETFLKTVGGAVDDITGIFGGGTNFASSITSKIGVLKQSTNWHTVPKMLYLNEGLMPLNHRDLINAELLWDKYHKEKSFVSDNWRGQKLLYNQVSVPFGFEDFLKLTTNPYFTFNGFSAKIVNFEWTVGEDQAVIDFWVRRPYTFNLKETKLIPQ